MRQFVCATAFLLQLQTKIVHFLIRTRKTFVGHSPNSFYWCGTMGIIVPLQEVVAVAPQGRREDQRPAQTHSWDQTGLIQSCYPNFWVRFCMFSLSWSLSLYLPSHPQLHTRTAWTQWGGRPGHKTHIHMLPTHPGVTQWGRPCED